MKTHIRSIMSTIISLKSCAYRINEQKKIGRCIVLTNGCFDILHRGHADYLHEARCLGDYLVVVLNSDNSIRKLKGPDRPIFNESDRSFMIASLEYVDKVIVVDSERLDKEFAILKPDVYVKGSDYSEETLDQNEYKALKTSGCEFKFISLTEGFSTTSIIERFKVL